MNTALPPDPAARETGPAAQDAAPVLLGEAVDVEQRRSHDAHTPRSATRCVASSRSAAAGNMDEFRAILARGMRLAFLLTIPSAIGLAMFASPIISVIYQHGRFNAQMTREPAGALASWLTSAVFTSAAGMAGA